MTYKSVPLYLSILALIVFAINLSGQDFASSETAKSTTAANLGAEEISDWREDLKFIARELPSKHANLFHRLERDKFYDSIKDLDAKIPNLSDQQVALEMARIVGLARDGHSYLSTIWDPKLKFQFLPIGLYVFVDGVYVTEASPEYKDILGARLKAVEGMPVNAVIDKLGPYMSTDNEFGIMGSAPYYLASPSVLYSLGISKTPDALRYEFEKNGKGVTLNAKLDPEKDNSMAAVRKDADNWVRVRNNSKNPTPLTYKHPEQSLWFEYVPDKKMLFVQMNNVLNSENKTIEQFFGEVVEAAGKNDVEKLVLDLRHNGGGNNTLVRPVIRGLIQMKDLDRPDRLFVIIGRRTFSAAQNLVNQLEAWTNASFVGEPTGSHVNMYGDARTFNLPKSGLRLRISELYWQNSHARDQRKWTAPNVAAEPDFVSFKENIDPAMRAIGSFNAKLTLDEIAAKRYATLDLEGFRQDVIGFKNDPANKYVEIEAKINRFGYNMIRAKQLDAAIGLFKINVELYPESWNVYDSLAEAYMLKGETNEAVRLYKKSLAMNPENKNAVEMLKRMGNASTDQKPVKH